MSFICHMLLHHMLPHFYFVFVYTMYDHTCLGSLYAVDFLDFCWLPGWTLALVRWADHRRANEYLGTLRGQKKAMKSLNGHWLQWRHMRAQKRFPGRTGTNARGAGSRPSERSTRKFELPETSGIGKATSFIPVFAA